MNIRERLRTAAKQLRQAGVPDPEYDSALLLSGITGVPPLTLRAETDRELTAPEEETFQRLLARRAEREPLQYIMGTVVFQGIPIETRPGVLIPRPETELLAEWAVERLSGKDNPEILDLCCGSGCLGLSLGVRLKGAHVTLTDLSLEAAALTDENRAALGLSCEILTGDLWYPVRGRRFDCVMSNPPYIPTEECGTLQPEVLREPVMALDGGRDGLDFYRRIAERAAEHLNPGGLLMMELGMGEAEPVRDLLTAGGAVYVEIRKDYAGIDRMILAEYP